MQNSSKTESPENMLLSAFMFLDENEMNEKWKCIANQTCYLGDSCRRCKRTSGVRPILDYLSLQSRAETYRRIIVWARENDIQLAEDCEQRELLFVRPTRLSNKLRTVASQSRDEHDDDTDDSSSSLSGSSSDVVMGNRFKESIVRTRSPQDDAMIKYFGCKSGSAEHEKIMSHIRYGHTVETLPVSSSLTTAEETSTSRNITTKSLFSKETIKSKYYMNDMLDMLKKKYGMSMFTFAKQIYEAEEEAMSLLQRHVFEPLQNVISEIFLVSFFLGRLSQLMDDGENAAMRVHLRNSFLFSGSAISATTTTATANTAITSPRSSEARSTSTIRDGFQFTSLETLRALSHVPLFMHLLMEKEELLQEGSELGCAVEKFARTAGFDLLHLFAAKSIAIQSLLTSVINDSMGKRPSSLPSTTASSQQGSFGTSVYKKPFIPTELLSSLLAHDSYTGENGCDEGSEFLARARKTLYTHPSRLPLRWMRIVPLSLEQTRRILFRDGLALECKRMDSFLDTFTTERRAELIALRFDRYSLLSSSSATAPPLSMAKEKKEFVLNAMDVYYTLTALRRAAWDNFGTSPYTQNINQERLNRDSEAYKQFREEMEQYALELKMHTTQHSSSSSPSSADNREREEQLNAAREMGKRKRIFKQSQHVRHSQFIHSIADETLLLGSSCGRYFYLLLPERDTLPLLRCTAIGETLRRISFSSVSSRSQESTLGGLLGTSSSLTSHLFHHFPLHKHPSSNGNGDKSNKSDDITPLSLLQTRRLTTQQPLFIQTYLKALGEMIGVSLCPYQRWTESMRTEAGGDATPFPEYVANLERCSMKYSLFPLFTVLRLYTAIPGDDAGLASLHVQLPPSLSEERCNETVDRSLSHEILTSCKSHGWLQNIAPRAHITTSHSNAQTVQNDGTNRKRKNMENEEQEEEEQEEEEEEQEKEEEKEEEEPSPYRNFYSSLRAAVCFNQIHYLDSDGVFLFKRVMQHHADHVSSMGGANALEEFNSTYGSLFAMFQAYEGKLQREIAQFAKSKSEKAEQEKKAQLSEHFNNSSKQKNKNESKNTDSRMGMSQKNSTFASSSFSSSSSPSSSFHTGSNLNDDDDDDDDDEDEDQDENSHEKHMNGKNGKTRVTFSPHVKQRKFRVKSSKRAKKSKEDSENEEDQEDEERKEQEFFEEYGESEFKSSFQRLPTNQEKRRRAQEKREKKASQGGDTTKKLVTHACRMFFAFWHVNQKSVHHTPEQIFFNNSTTHRELDCLPVHAEEQKFLKTRCFTLVDFDSRAYENPSSPLPANLVFLLYQFISDPTIDFVGYIAKKETKLRSDVHTNDVRELRLGLLESIFVWHHLVHQTFGAAGETFKAVTVREPHYGFKNPEVTENFSAKTMEMLRNEPIGSEEVGSLLFKQLSTSFMTEAEVLESRKFAGQYWHRARMQTQAPMQPDVNAGSSSGANTKKEPNMDSKKIMSLLEEMNNSDMLISLTMGEKYLLARCMAWLEWKLYFKFSSLINSTVQQRKFATNNPLLTALQQRYCDDGKKNTASKAPLNERNQASIATPTSRVHSKSSVETTTSPPLRSALSTGFRCTTTSAAYTSTKTASKLQSTLKTTKASLRDKNNVVFKRPISYCANLRFHSGPILGSSDGNDAPIVGAATGDACGFSQYYFKAPTISPSCLPSSSQSTNAHIKATAEREAFVENALHQGMEFKFPIYFCSSQIAFDEKTVELLDTILHAGFNHPCSIEMDKLMCKKDCNFSTLAQSFEEQYMDPFSSSSSTTTTHPGVLPPTTTNSSSSSSKTTVTSGATSNFAAVTNKPVLCNNQDKLFVFKIAKKWWSPISATTSATPSHTSASSEQQQQQSLTRCPKFLIDPMEHVLKELQQRVSWRRGSSGGGSFVGSENPHFTALQMQAHDNTGLLNSMMNSMISPRNGLHNEYKKKEFRDEEMRKKHYQQLKADVEKLVPLQTQYGTFFE
jgi:hypothetical protein